MILAAVLLWPQEPTTNPPAPTEHGWKCWYSTDYGFSCQDARRVLRLESEVSSYDQGYQQALEDMYLRLSDLRKDHK
jgi:hypothetical protein